MFDSIPKSWPVAVALWSVLLIVVAGTSVFARRLAVNKVYRGRPPKHGGPLHIARLLLFLSGNTTAFVIGAAVPIAALDLACSYPEHFFLSNGPVLIDEHGNGTSDVYAAAAFSIDQALKGGLNDFAEVFAVDVGNIAIAENVLALKVVVFLYRILLNVIAFYALWRASLLFADLIFIWVPLPKDSKGNIRRINLTHTSQGYLGESVEATDLEFVPSIGSPKFHAAATRE